ncbi:hypothetical protein [Kribbella sp. HUAS MG21]|uniref:Uncharacterized protein n=1 Tax=Kribbella sp. HUAS MG21 TaxID=3160966 RepID=A0AAU7TM66_9ACTN
MPKLGTETRIGSPGWALVVLRISGGGEFRGVAGALEFCDEAEGVLRDVVPALVVGVVRSAVVPAGLVADVDGSAPTWRRSSSPLDFSCT